MTAVEIQHEEGRYWAALPGGQEAELTYRRQSDGVIAATHTGVPRAFEGRGIAAALVERMVADARASGTRIVPLCSYVDAQFRRHPDWADLRA